VGVVLMEISVTVLVERLSTVKVVVVGSVTVTRDVTETLDVSVTDLFFTTYFDLVIVVGRVT
jgi:hypothetical protein